MKNKIVWQTYFKNYLVTYDACFGVVDVQLGPDGDIRDGNPLRMEKGRKIFSRLNNWNFIGTSDRSSCSIFICEDSGIQRYCDPKAETCHNDCRKDQEPFFNNDDCKWDCKVNFERKIKTKVIIKQMIFLNFDFKV